MKKLRTAVIGVGNMGRHHARIYSEITNLVGVSDLDEKQGKALAKERKTIFYKNYQELLEKNEIDCISIAVPTSEHAQIAIDCLNRKIPTLVEKPLANNVQEANKIIATSKKNKTLLMVGHIERYNPAVTKLKEMVDSGDIGEILSMLAVRVGISPPVQKKSDVVSDLAIHDIDVFNYLLNETPKKTRIVKQQLKKDNISDAASILLEYKNAIGMIQTNWITPIKIRKLYITGSKQYVELDYIAQQITSNSRSLGERHKSGFFEFLTTYEPIEENVQVIKKEPLKEELKVFLKLVKSGESIDSTYALNAVKIVTEQP